MTPESAARIKALMQLQRYSGLSLVDAVCLSKDELQRTSGGIPCRLRPPEDRHACE